MKVSKLTIHRIQVDMSCGCRVGANFKDGSYREPLVPDMTDKCGPPTLLKEFSFCGKHQPSPDKSMLEFVLSERLDEVIEEAKPVPRIPVPSGIPVNQKGLEGESVNKVAVVASRNARPGQPPPIKTIRRSTGQLEAVGALLPTEVASTAKGRQPEPELSSVEDLDKLLAEPERPKN